MTLNDLKRSKRTCCHRGRNVWLMLVLLSYFLFFFSTLFCSFSIGILPIHPDLGAIAATRRGVGLRKMLKYLMKSNNQQNKLWTMYYCSMLAVSM